MTAPVCFEEPRPQRSWTSLDGPPAQRSAARNSSSASTPASSLIASATGPNGSSTSSQHGPGRTCPPSPCTATSGCDTNRALADAQGAAGPSRLPRLAESGPTAQLPVAELQLLAPIERPGVVAVIGQQLTAVARQHRRQRGRVAGPQRLHRTPLRRRGSATPFRPAATGPPLRLELVGATIPR